MTNEQTAPEDLNEGNVLKSFLNNNYGIIGRTASTRFEPNTNTGGATPYQLANRLNDLGNTRHLVEHNNAIVDELFLRRNPTTTYRLGERVNIEPNEIGQAIALVETLAEDLNKKAIEKFWAR